MVNPKKRCLEDKSLLKTEVDSCITFDQTKCEEIRDLSEKCEDQTLLVMYYKSLLKLKKLTDRMSLLKIELPTFPSSQ